MKLQLFMLGAAMVTTLGASAQFSAGSSSASGDFSSSYDRAQVSYVNEKYSAKGAGFSTNGVGVKYLHGFGISQDRPLYIQTGADLHFGFNSESTKFSSQKLTTMNIAIPVNVAYQFAINDKFTIEPYVGLNVKVNILAKQKNTIKSINFDDLDDEDWSDYEDYFDEDMWGDMFDPEDFVDGKESSSSVSLFDKKKVGKDAQWKRFQLGWHIGANFILNQKYYLSAQYGTDFMSICKKTNTSTLSIGLGMNF